MAGHDRAHARGDGCAKRREFDAVQMRAVAGDGWQIEMRIDAGVAMAGEVLGGGQSAIFFDSAHEGGDEFRHALGIFAERARVDDRDYRDCC